VTRPLAIAVLALAALAAPAGAQVVEKPEDVQRVERAVLDLSATKRNLAGEVAASRRAAERALAKCRTAGPGWARIRSVRVPAQRSLYARGARILWRNLGEVAAEHAAFEAYRRPFERFVSRFEPPLGDPVLQAGVEAWNKRIALYAAYTPIGTCRSFNRLAKRARQFPENVGPTTWWATSTTGWSASSTQARARRPGATGARATTLHCARRATGWWPWAATRATPPPSRSGTRFGG